MFFKDHLQAVAVQASDQIEVPAFLQKPHVSGGFGLWGQDEQDACAQND